MMLSVAPDLYRTDYDRQAASVGVVHLGYGAFHRAHQAVYLDDYMQATGDLGWGIVAVNLRASESAAFAASAEASDGYLLKTMAPDGSVAHRLVRAHLAHADWTRDRDAAEALVAQPGVHLVSMTVTESGYCLDNDFALNTDDPVIRAEVAGGVPVTIYAYLARALDRRRRATGQPLTLLCCDNIRGNGKMLRRNLLAYLGLTGCEALASWVAENVAFPCSMVDRITPRATPELAAEIAVRYPGPARDPVHAEDFIQWVLEDRFAGPAPDLARVGVQIVGDVDPYEEAKIRILNGGHTGLAYLGALAGHDTFDQAMADSALRTHFDNWERREVLPGLTLDLPFDKTAYLDQIAARFSNAAIADQLERICMDGYSKMPIFVRPTLASCLAQGIEPRHGYDCIASWYVFARRHAAGVARIDYHDPAWDVLAPMLAPGQEETFARTEQLWADLPGRHPGFVPGILAAIEQMEQTWPA